MTGTITTFLKKKYKIIALHSYCLLILLKNLLLIKTLKLRGVSLSDIVVIQDNEIEILWDVKGCHKIEVNGIGIFPGNSYGIKFVFSNQYNPLEIIFYGIAKKVKRSILIEYTKINFLSKVIAITEIPDNPKLHYNRKQIELKLSNEDLVIENHAPQIEIENIYFEFEKFKFEKY
jgi:hypothetical protein